MNSVVIGTIPGIGEISWNGNYFSAPGFPTVDRDVVRVQLGYIPAPQGWHLTPPPQLEPMVHHMIAQVMSGAGSFDPPPAPAFTDRRTDPPVTPRTEPPARPRDPPGSLPGELEPLEWTGIVSPPPPPLTPPVLSTFEIQTLGLSDPSGSPAPSPTIHSIEEAPTMASWDSYLPSGFNPGSFTPAGAGPGFANMPATGSSSNIDWRQVAMAGGAVACNRIANEALRAACLALAATLAGGQTGGGGTTLAPSCPTGFEPDGKGGCRRTGVTSWLPGDVGTPDTGWAPMNGRYGAGVSPVVFARTHRQCPAGYALGKDGVCYDRISRANRAWDPGRKPLLTGGDLNALARARRLTKTIDKLKRKHGSKPRVAAKATRRKR